MIPTEQTISLKGLGMLLRIIAVVFSSVATIFSTAIPLFFHYSLATSTIITVVFILLSGAILIHGILTHTFNDLADHHSGTDYFSPGVLSGGSRVLQTGTMSTKMLVHIGRYLLIILLFMTCLFLYFGHVKFAILTLIGIWSAMSYSLKPLQLAYYPFVGEWLSLLPAMVALGIAAPWILLDQIPIWAWQNALINAFWCMAWVMVHHIPDRDADRLAQPKKSTTVVWAEDIFGQHATKFPAYLYFTIVSFLLIWTAFTRPIGAIGGTIILIYSVISLIKMHTEDVEEVTQIEKILLLLAFFTAILLGMIMS